MPVTQITLLPGYPPEVRERLVNHVSAAVRSVIASPEAGTTTFVQEAATYRRDGRVFTEGRQAHPPASVLVRAFLQAMQSRELEHARGFLAPGFEMCFPGGARFRHLEELVAWGRERYQSVAKTFERFDECWAADGTVGSSPRWARRARRRCARDWATGWLAENRFVRSPASLRRL